MDLGLRHLKVVVTVAEAGSISRAAAALSIAQPGLTAQIKRIEQDLGGPLFERRPEGVVPTELGTHFVLRARDLLAQFDDLLASTRALGCEATPASSILIGASGGGNWLPRVTGIVADLLPDHEQFVYVEEQQHRLLASLRAGKLDLGLITEYPYLPTPRLTGLAGLDLGKEPLLIGLPDRHPLAGRDLVSLRELAEEAWVVPAGRSEELRLSLRLACERTGFSPRFRHFGVDHTTAADIIRGGRAIGAFLAHDVPAAGLTLARLVDGQLWRRTRLVWPLNSPIAAVAKELTSRTGTAMASVG
ncbi:DNA-binding transcriptional regulator, LysR family [Amycolatopsis xylanica]|uniref:DNA-binding transcriptional regulator, LysR family n=1 Tax=Amycolatopsis xylanica TaxID=589385 RepID=A0A1H2V2I8_9PSEU|nr:LysR family transcriptional regulator [Amycolatopsis xylanica]SDW62169.1 DNA-binding transcriptional regulator, LysR family [Amycolatopsis xylanica]